jgi:general secretion pathway protein D
MESLCTRLFAVAVCLSLMTARVHAADDAADGSDDPPAAAIATGADDPSADGASADSPSDGPSAESERVPAGVPAESSRSGDQDLITMNFQNVDISVLAKFISEITGRNFIIDESVRGKVSIVSPTKVTPQQAYSIFQSVLQVKGFTTVRAGAVTKIVPAREVRQSAELTQSQEPEGDQYVTRMVKLRNTDATSVMSVIQPMISHDGLIAAFPQDNTLIITDNAYNVQRLLRIIGSLDVHGMQQNVTVIPLKLAFAADLSQQIEKIMTAREATTHGGIGGMMRPGMGVVAPSAQGAATTFSVVPDERTNSLIVLASPLEMRQIKDLVEKLDIHPPNETYRIHVYQLKYAPAAEMVSVLNGLLGGGGGPSSLSPTTGRNSLGRGSSLGSFGGGSGFGSGFGAGSGGYGGYGGNSSFGGGSSGGSMGSFGGGMGSMVSSLGSLRGGSNSGPATANSAGGNSNGRSTVFENPVSITADPATNSLVVSSAPQDFETLRRVIAELDIPRVQVFVQAIIVEVSVNRSKQIGVNLIGSTSLGGGGNALGVGTLNFGDLQSALGNPLGLSGLGIGLASGSRCSIPAAAASSIVGGSGSNTSNTVTAPCDIALMTALQTDTHSNVLSAPTLLTADNEEAMIVVGENLPFVGSSAANSGLPGQIFNSVDRQNVGITLDIVPQVSAGEYVKLDIYEEVSNVVPGTGNQATNPLGPTTTIRSASTTVLVQNHRTAVIGGLISSDAETGRQGIPFLSDIPVLGNLFSSNLRQTTKQNLLVFLTPHVVHTRQDLQELALDERQKFAQSIGRREINSMPASQFQQLYQPTFNTSLSPQQQLMQQQAPEGGYAPMPGSTTPLDNTGPSAGPASMNTEEIGPSSRNNTAPRSPTPGMVAGAAAAPATAAAYSASSSAPASASPSTNATAASPTVPSGLPPVPPSGPAAGGASAAAASSTFGAASAGTDVPR